MGAAQHRMRGLSREHEVQQDKLYRDIRTPFEKFGDLLADEPALSITLTLILLPLAPFFPTFFMIVCVPVIYWMTSKPLNKEQTLPMLLPKEAGIKDARDPKPSRAGNHTARGEYLVGNLRFSNKPYELWLSFSHLLTHSLLIGATGSGKTETLVSMTANYLSVGSGVMYADAKAAPKLGWQIFSLARFFGREDDFRALNYIKGNSSVKPDPAVRRGNNVNLFAYGSAESITQIIVSLMPPGGDENKLFSERAVGLISAVMPALVDLRDHANLKITPGVIRKALEFEEVQKLKRAKPVKPESREALRAYLTSLPGYKENPTDRNGRPTDKQAEEVTRQFGFAQAYFTRALASLSDTYGDIYMVGRGEISFLDQVLRRRICVVMIPALEKAPDEMKNLAKIVLAAQKNAISTGLPPDIEGRKEDVLDNLPTTAPTPYGIINDEFAFMMTPGYGSVLAQARGLYCAVCIAGQDYAGMKREDADEAEQIAENTKLKIVMASEGLGATKELIQEIAGEGVASVAQSYAMDDDSLSGMYRDSKSASFEKRSRVDTQDTRSSVEGEGIIFWRDNIVPVTMFYHGLDEDTIVSDFVIHRLIDVGLPTRGYGATLIEKESPMLSTLRQAVREGQSLDVSDDYIPDTLETPLKPALLQYRNVLRKNVVSDELDKDGLLFAALMAQYTEQITNAPDDDIESGDPDMGERPVMMDTTLSDTVSTMAPPERRSEGFEHADDNEVYQIDEDLGDTLAAIKRDADSDSSLQAPPPPPVPGATSKSQDDAYQPVPADKKNPAKDTWIEDYTFLINPQDLANASQRGVTDREAVVANRIGQGVARMEAALGTPPEEAQAVGRQTAIASAKAINYPGAASRPTPPQTEAEEQLIVESNSSTLTDWINQAKNT
ncbi:MAG: intracellular multiplication protein IcmO [Marinobacter sp. T13-3]|nr:MAG: intracellular multiplication protein IcmO [Marinobacter sp. T13-3]